MNNFTMCSGGGDKEKNTFADLELTNRLAKLNLVD